MAAKVLEISWKVVDFKAVYHKKRILHDLVIISYEIYKQSLLWNEMYYESFKWIFFFFWFEMWTN